MIPAGNYRNPVKPPPRGKNKFLVRAGTAPQFRRCVIVRPASGAESGAVFHPFLPYLLFITFRSGNPGSAPEIRNRPGEPPSERNLQSRLATLKNARVGKFIAGDGNRRGGGRGVVVKTMPPRKIFL